jgi:hypothetical protein
MTAGLLRERRQRRRLRRATALPLRFEKDSDFPEIGEDDFIDLVGPGESVPPIVEPAIPAILDRDQRMGRLFRRRWRRCLCGTLLIAKRNEADGVLAGLRRQWRNA